MQTPSGLKIELSLKDRTIQTYSFAQEKVIIGRDPDADVFIDNTGISRAHTRIEWIPGATYMIQDLGSTNGTFLNGNPIRKEPLRNNDVITIGKFILKVTVEEEGAESIRRPEGKPSEDFEGTTVLSADQLKKMMAKVESERQGGVANPATPAAAKLQPAPVPARMPIGRMVIGGILILIFGVAIGVGIFILR